MSFANSTTACPGPALPVCCKLQWQQGAACSARGHRQQMCRGWSIILLLLTLCSSCKAHPDTAAAQHEVCGQHHPLVAQQQAVLRRRLQQLRQLRSTDVLQPGVYAFSDDSSSGGGGSTTNSSLPGAAAAAAATNSDMPRDNAENQRKAAPGGSSSAQQAGKAAAAGAAAAAAAAAGGSKHTPPPGMGPLLPSKLRIGTVFQLQGLSKNDSTRVQEQLVPAAVRVLQRYIKVLRPAGGVLRVDAAFGDGQQGCLISQVDAHLAVGNVGMRDTDLVLYVSSDASTCMPGMIAIATACDVEPTTKRPILGSLNICGDALEGLAGSAPGSDDEATAVGRLVEVLVHEMVHVLGFGSIHYDDWRGPDGKRYGKDNVVKKVGGRPYLATPEVTAVARKFFGCGSLPGAPLENEGPSFSAISHFEYRLLQRELMSPARPIDRSRSRLSAFTLAALEDTGWYVADYSQVEVLDWGSNAGCDFVTSSCWDYMNKAPEQPYFCGKGTVNQTRCTAQAAGWGVCRSSAFSDGCLLVGKYSTNGAAVVSDMQQPSSEDGRQAACYSPPQLQQMAAAAGTRDNGNASLLPLLGGSYSARRSDICYNLVQPKQQPHDDIVWVGGHGQLPEDVGKDMTAPPVQATDGRQQQQQPQRQQQQQQQRSTESARLPSAQQAAACVKLPASAGPDGSSTSGSNSNTRQLLSMSLPDAVLPRPSQRHLAEVAAAAGPLAVAGVSSLAALDSIQRQLASQSSAIASSMQAASAACTSSSVLCFQSSCDSAGRLWVTATPPDGSPVTFACPSRAAIDLSKQLPNRYLLGFLQCPSNALVCESVGCADCSQSGGYCSQGKCYCHMERYGKGCAETLVPKLT